MKNKYLIIINLCLIMIYSCDEEGNLLEAEELSLNGTYIVTNIMIYPNGDCSSVPSNNGICESDSSITQESDCPDNDWMSYVEQFENWHLTLEDSGVATINDGDETESLTYAIDGTNLTITDSDDETDTIDLSDYSMNNSLTVNLSDEAHCVDNENDIDMDEYTAESDCNNAGFEWEEAYCIDITFTLSETAIDNDEDEGPPSCVEDCPSFDDLDDCDYDDENCDANADCTIIASWANDDCLADCEGEDADEVNMVLAACTDCIANETDCEEALEDVYDEEDDEGPPSCVEDCPSFDDLDDCDYDDENCDANADCTIIASWANDDCLADCEGEDADEVNMVLAACTDCIANETDCEEALEDVYDEEDDEGPPSCVEDCPDFDLLLTDFDCDSEADECLDETSICTIIANWEGNDCLSDCTGEDNEEVTMIMQACTDCIANPDIDCTDALDAMDDDEEDIDCSMYTLIDECLEMDGCHYVEEFDANGNAINGWCENDYEGGPPSCVEDCPNFDDLDDCDYDDEDCDANADCTIVASWANDDCLSDCEQEDADEVNMVLSACTDCITNQTDCQEALDDDTWTDELPEAPACVEDCANFDILDDDHSYTDTEVCEFLVQWTECISDCEGDDLTFVNDIINLCNACLTSNTCDEEMP